MDNYNIILIQHNRMDPIKIGVSVYNLLPPHAPWRQWLHCSLKHWNSFSMWFSVSPKAEVTYSHNVHV